MSRSHSKDDSAPAKAPEAADVSAVVQQLFARQQRFMVDGAEEWAETAFRFWSRRLGAYADHLHALKSCETPSAILAANNSFLSDALTSYAEEARALVRLGQKEAPAEEAEPAAQPQAA